MPSSLNTWSCLACKRRKVRCDRRTPCSNCVRRGTNCNFPTSGRIPRRPDQHQSEAPSDVPQRTELIGKLRRVEDLLQQRVHDAPARSFAAPLVTSVHSTPARSRSALQQQSYAEQSTQRLKRSRTIDPGPTSLVTGLPDELDAFWQTVQEEVRTIRHSLEHDEGSDGEHLSKSDPSPTVHTAGLDRRGERKGLFAMAYGEDGDKAPSPFLTSPSVLRFLWQTYQENVDPFVKVLHTPSIERTLKQCYCDADALPVGMQALLACICFAALVSMPSDEVQSRFHDKRSTLIEQSRARVKHILDQADYMNTSEFAVIQGLTIYLTVLPNIESMRCVWLMTGLLVRLAVTLSLHRDTGSDMHMSVLDTEIRRRIWWHICMLDLRVGDSRFQGFLISETLFDTQPPANVDDTDLSDGVSRARTGPTDCAIAVSKCELWRLDRMIRAAVHTASDADKTHIQRHRTIERYRLATTDPAMALSRDVKTASYIREDLIMMTARLDLMENYRHAKESGRDSWNDPHLIRKAVEVLTQVSHLVRNPSTARFAWITRGYVQWQSLGFVLNHLSSRPWSEESEVAWLAVVRHIEDIPRATQKDMLWPQLQKLLAQAGGKRDEYNVERWSAAATEASQAMTQPAVQPPVLLSQNSAANTAWPAAPQHFGNQPPTVLIPSGSSAHLTTFPVDTGGMFDPLTSAGTMTATPPLVPSNYSQLPVGYGQPWLFPQPAGSVMQPAQPDWQQWNGAPGYTANATHDTLADQG